MDRPVVCFIYKNHRGEVAERTVTVDALQYMRNVGYGYEDGWFLSGHCHTKNERRSFALCNIIVPGPVRGSGHSVLDLLTFTENTNDQ